MNKKPIVIFDSGVGGLTVLKAFLTQFPPHLYGGSYVYIGDTARLPYGTKSPETILKYTINLTKCALTFDPALIVVACNTASAHGLEAAQNIAAAYHTPVLGMIKPAVHAALQSTKNNHICVLATAGTVASQIYKREIQKNSPQIEVTEIACQMLVALAEEGWVDTQIARTVIQKYLNEILKHKNKPDVFILGCTHFPLFEEILKEELGNSITLINTGLEAAKQSEFLKINLPSKNLNLEIKAFATDNIEGFQNRLSYFLHPFDKDIDVQLLDL